MAGRRGRRPGGRGVSRTTVQRWARGAGVGLADGGRGRKALWRPPGAGAAGAPVGACARGPLARAMIGCGPGAGGLGPPSSPPRVRPVPAHRVGRDPPRGGRGAGSTAGRRRGPRPGRGWPAPRSADWTPTRSCASGSSTRPGNRGRALGGRPDHRRATPGSALTTPAGAPQPVRADHPLWRRATAPAPSPMPPGA